MKVATSLLLALEESAFLLAGVLNEPNYILETYEILSKSFISFFMKLVHKIGVLKQKIAIR